MSFRLATLGWCARRLVRTLVGMYYAPVRFTGRERLPKGPILFVANHQDSLLDPVLVGSLARREVRFLAKATLFDVPVLGSVIRSLGMIPAYRPQDDASQMKRNLEILDRAAEALAAGHCVGIFPEGKSHDLPCIEQIKSGTARIAMKAVQLGAKPQLVAVGMNFERKESFRTALWVQAGDPLDLADFLSGHGHEKQAQRALTAEIESRLKRVALHLDNPELLPLLDQLEHLVPRPGLNTPGPLARLQLRKRVADAMNHFYAADPPRAESAAQQILAYGHALQGEGLKPGSPVMRYRRLRLTLRLVRDTASHLFGIVPALAGLAHHAVPFVVSRWLAARVCPRGRMTMALARLAFGLPLMIATYVGVWFALRSYFLPWVAWTWTLAMPFCGFFALKRLRKLRRGGQALAAQARLCLQKRKLQALRTQQAEVRTLVTTLADEYAKVRPRGSPLELPWTWRRIGGVALRWGVTLLVLSLLWVGYAHWRRSRMALALGGMELRHLPAADLRFMLDADEALLRQVLPQIPARLDEARVLASEFASGKRSWYSQADNDELRKMLRDYVTLRTALVRVVWRYQKSFQVTGEALRARTFLCACTAGTALASASLGFVESFNGSGDAVKKLNEAEPSWDIPPGVFDTVRRSLCSNTNRTALMEAGKEYDGTDWKALALQEPYAAFHDSIRDCRRRLADADDDLTAERLKQPLRDARDEGKDLLYGVQALVSVWMGDTKLREPGGALISSAQLKELSAKLQPGDIILERRNWYVSNAFLPGYWPHAALYVGTPEDLQKFGLHHDPRVQTHWEKYLRQDARGHSCVVLESISEGVVFTSLEHSVGEADSVAFLRPRLTQDQVREAIARTFSHAASPTISSSTSFPLTSSSARNSSIAPTTEPSNFRLRTSWAPALCPPLNSCANSPANAACLRPSSNSSAASAANVMPAAPASPTRPALWPLWICRGATS
jgi:glycerol-3-phosphate O-acyltransferase/dihydroxyacetone phosphate acyltransferase